MRTNSLAFRLTLSSALVAVVLLLATGLLLNSLFHAALERSFDARLRSVMDALQANTELKPDGTPFVIGAANDSRYTVADSRYTLPASGWYWQVRPLNPRLTGLASGSLLNTELKPDPALLAVRDADGFAAFLMNDFEGKQVRAVEQRLTLFGSMGEYSFLVTGNYAELLEEVASFRRALYISLGLLGAGLLVATLLQVLYGLRPMKEMERKLTDIRRGKVEMLDGNFPAEMQPVADEMNLLIQSNFEIIDRARMQVGNLAHALKTPISVLTNEARDQKDPLAHKVREQIGVMRDQVNLYLDRARRAARAQTIGAATDVDPVLQSLARTLQRINRDKGVEVTVEPVPANLKFRGERQDLEEMVGNLLDNACKWAKSKVAVRAKLQTQAGDDGRPWMLIEVDDDGPGLKPEQRATAMKRGQRLDETKPGSGLGLNIVSETAAMHGGKAELDDAELGGLRAILRLPALA